MILAWLTGIVRCGGNNLVDLCDMGSKFRKAAALAVASVLTVLAATPSHAIIVERNFSLDLDPSQLFNGGLGASWFSGSVTFAPLTLNVGDTARINVAFENGEQLQISDDDNLLAAIGNLNVVGGSGSINVISDMEVLFTGTTGDVLNPLMSGVAPSGSGPNALSSIESGNITNSVFSAQGLRIDFEVVSATAGIPEEFNNMTLSLFRAATMQINSANIPEPTTLALFGLGLAGLAYTRRRKAA